ncbi:ketopantoate reductase family protein [Dethiosulfatarculus sandiegensis]|uniref:2-dehydropantoate 2-reductase n=1 Tax=Dethiosulfatarculus sandiegensis TaxID=1429043 RepID=A0A0D2J2D6_9BACT|nr:ketopantoate reductase family protein [Dethiosulfatarculus sandiegensis]KIX12379.1 hypothetical protein X474_19455 [Dethiosulfatarculus sandiegensis]
MTRIQRVFVVGAGALGSSLAGLLKKAAQTEPVLVGKSPHLKAISQKGLLFISEDGAEELIGLATAEPAEVPFLGAGDLVLLAGKMTDAPFVSAWLKEKAAADTTVVALQNGIMVAKAWEELLSRPVDRGLAFYGANSLEPGRVTCYEGALRFKHSERTEDLCELFAGLSLRCRVKDDFESFVWIKLAINCLANPLAGILGANNRGLSRDVLNPAKKAILDEVLAVAQSRGVLLDLTVEKINGYLSGENIPSLHTDLVRGRPTEIEYLNGAVARLGREKGIPCPANELISSLVRYQSGQSIH